MNEAMEEIDLGSQTEHLFVSDDEEEDDDRLNKHLEQSANQKLLLSKKANLGEIDRHEEGMKEGLLEE